jgi:hypothetical protein
MDIDGDGIISIYEMEYFYEDQIKKMTELGMEILSFEDCLCQVLYMILFIICIRGIRVAKMISKLLFSHNSLFIECF